MVRALDGAGVLVDDVEVHQPSLDDVFFALTGHPADAGPDTAESAPEATATRVPSSKERPYDRPRRPDRAGSRRPPIATGWAPSWHDVVVLTRRNLRPHPREPLQLSDVTVQPVLFTLLFIYVFGSGVPIHGGSYKDFAIAGLMLLNLTTSAMGTAVGLSTDLTTGAIDRFRTLPMWRSAVLVGRSMADCPLGRPVRRHRGPHRPGHRLAARGQCGLGRSAASASPCSSATPCRGAAPASASSRKGPESAQGVGLIILFPLAIVSNALVPTQGMPGWLQIIANWNPVSAVTAAVRHLFGNPNPSGRRPRLADAASGGGRPRLVARHPRWSSPRWPPSSSGAAPPAEPTEASAPADGPVPVARG